MQNGGKKDLLGGITLRTRTAKERRKDERIKRLLTTSSLKKGGVQVLTWGNPPNED